MGFSRRRSQTLEAPVEVLLQILDVLEAGAVAYHRSAAGLKPRRGAGRPCSRPEREAFEAAPGIAQGEQLEAVDQRVDAARRSVSGRRKGPMSRKSRASKAHAGSSGKAGWSTRLTSGGAASHRQRPRKTLASCSRISSVRRPRIARKTSSGPAEWPSGGTQSCRRRTMPLWRRWDRSEDRSGRRYIWCRLRWKVDAKGLGRAKQRARPGIVHHDLGAAPCAVAAIAGMS